MEELGGDGERGAHPEAAERAGVEPLAGCADGHELRRAADHVAAVADHHGLRCDHRRDLPRPPVVRDRNRVGRALGFELGATLPLLLADPAPPLLEARGQPADRHGKVVRSREGELERAVASELGGVTVHHDDARVLGEGRRPPVSQAEVQWRAQHEHEIGAGQCPAPRVGEGARVTGRQRAAAGTVHEDRQTRSVGERSQRLGGVVPVDTTARQDHGPLRSRDEVREPHHVVRVGQRRAPVDVARRDRRQPVLDHRHQEVDGDLDEDRAGAAAEGGADGGGEHLGDLTRFRDRPRALGDRTEQRHLLRLLERAQSAEPERRGAADQEQRAPRRVGVGHARDGIGHAGPGGHHRHSNIAGEPRVGVPRMGTGLLVAHVHHLEALAHAAVVDGQDMAAAEREDMPHARFLERPGDQVSAGQIRHLTRRGAPPLFRTSPQEPGCAGKAGARTARTSRDLFSCALSSRDHWARWATSVRDVPDDLAARPRGQSPELLPLDALSIHALPDQRVAHPMDGLAATAHIDHEPVDAVDQTLHRVPERHRLVLARRGDPEATREERFDVGVHPAS